MHSCTTAVITDEKNNNDATATAELEEEDRCDKPHLLLKQMFLIFAGNFSGSFRDKNMTQTIISNLFIHSSAGKLYTFSTKSRLATVPAPWGRSQAAAPGDQQGQGLVASGSTVSPLLKRKASCWGSRPRNFLNISEASSEPPGRRMYFL